VEQNQYQGRIAELVELIKGLQPQLDAAAKAFRDGPNSAIDARFDKWIAMHWCKNAYGNALIRLRLIVEQNFHFIETLGLLAVTRYVFELSVWLHLLKNDPRFGMIYYRELLECQLRYYKDTITHYRREVLLLLVLDKEDAAKREELIAKTKASPETAAQFGAALKQAMAEVDSKAGRAFSVFSHDAITNGYGFQAHLVETKSIPEIEKYVLDIERELAEFQRTVPNDVRDIARGRWQWRQMAEKVGLANEHDYIYSHASKLTHATPASLTTDQKNLELPEMYIFLRYIYAKLLEALDLARAMSARESLH
jgi:hypothetical protein